MQVYVDAIKLFSKNPTNLSSSKLLQGNVAVNEHDLTRLRHRPALTQKQFAGFRSVTQSNDVGREDTELVKMSFLKACHLKTKPTNNGKLINVSERTGEKPKIQYRNIIKGYL